MLKRKFVFSFVAAIAWAVCLISCQEDEEVPQTEFIKKVTGHIILNTWGIEQDFEDDLLLYSSSQPQQSPNAPDAAYFLSAGTSVFMNGNELGFNLTIYPVTVGDWRLVNQTFDSAKKEAQIIVGNKTANIRYYPSPENPVKLHVSSLSDTPFPLAISAELSGVLYNQDNPKDSLILENVNINVKY